MSSTLDRPSADTAEPRRYRRTERRLKTLALRALGLRRTDRSRVVEEMFIRQHRDAVGFWLQLLLSMGIATVGLVLGSTAVVIGAMLIAPLMGPIVEFGMALVLGSPVLTIRSFGRMMGGILAVIAGAALLTLLLPFHEINPEIASRTSPTALDLVLAIFVALAAAFTTVRSSSETTSAAAGTAIGIALVPPLCVIGFGLGIRDAEVAGGATLLFITNLTAIVLISVLFFLALGFDRVRAERWEEAVLRGTRPGGLIQRAVAMLRRVFGSRYGRVLRIGVPLLLVASVVAPLTQALDQVAWEVRTRTAVSRIVDQALEGRDAVQTRISVQAGAVATQLYLVGSMDEAAALEEELRRRIAASAGVEPTVRVIAVPDSRAMRQLAGAQPAAAPPPTAQLPEITRQIGQAVAAVWPAAQLGPVVDWQLEPADSVRTRLVVRHLGAPAGPATEVLLSQALSSRAGTELLVRTRALPPGVVSEPLGRGPEWLPALSEAADAVRESAALLACVEIPAAESLATSAEAREAAERARTVIRSLPAGRAAVQSAADRWSVRLSTTPCPVPDPAVAPPR